MLGQAPNPAPLSHTAAPPDPAARSAGEVHLWVVRVPSRREGGRLPGGECPSEVGRLANVLSTPERQRARAYADREDADRFVTGRGLLRHILGAYLDEAPGRLQFRQGPHGKPCLEGRGDGMEFNVSYARDLAMLGFARVRRIGVDVEAVRPSFDFDGIVSRFYSAEEKDVLDGLRGAGRVHAFFQTWTCKEAYLKAKGCGLMGLREAPLRFEKGRPLLLSADAVGWHLEAIRPAPGHVGAVAFERRPEDTAPPVVRVYTWTSPCSLGRLIARLLARASAAAGSGRFGPPAPGVAA